MDCIGRSCASTMVIQDAYPGTVSWDAMGRICGETATVLGNYEIGDLGYVLLAGRDIEGEVEGGSFPRPALGPDAPAMSPDDPLHRR